MTERFTPAVVSAQMAGTPDRTASTSADQRERAFINLAPYRDGIITLGKFSGTSQWERHPNGDELVQIVDGEVVLRIEHDSIRMQAGDMIVIPADSWHQIYAREMSSVLYVTPQPTIHLESGDPTNRQFDPLSGPGEWLLAAFMRAWFWLSRE